MAINNAIIWSIPNESGSIRATPLMKHAALSAAGRGSASTNRGFGYTYRPRAAFTLQIYDFSGLRPNPDSKRNDRYPDLNNNKRNVPQRIGAAGRLQVGGVPGGLAARGVNQGLFHHHLLAVYDVDAGGEGAESRCAAHAYALKVIYRCGG